VATWGCSSHESNDLTVSLRDYNRGKPAQERRYRFEPGFEYAVGQAQQHAVLELVLIQSNPQGLDVQDAGPLPAPRAIGLATEPAHDGIGDWIHQQVADKCLPLRNCGQKAQEQDIWLSPQRRSAGPKEQRRPQP